MLTIKDVPAILNRCIRTGTNLSLIGEPGIGKTSVIVQAVAKIQETNPDFKLWLMYTPTMNPTDFAMAMPDMKAGKLRVFNTGLLPNAYETPDAQGIVYFGERDGGDRETNKATQKYINNEDMPGLRKPKGVIVVADSNDISHRSGATQQSLALISRSRQVEVGIDVRSLLAYFADIGMNPFVQAYLSLRPEHVSTFDILLKNKGYGIWANPRGWERLGKSLDDAEAHGETLTPDEVIGDIGEAVGREFIAFCKSASLVSYEEIVSDPHNATRPDKLSDVYAIIAMLATATGGAEFPNVRTYVERWGMEIQVLFLRLLTGNKGRNKVDCVSTKAYGSWFSQPEILDALGVPNT
jgi:RecA/RadA recombinase